MYRQIIGFAAVLLLIGAGCTSGPVDEETTPTKATASTKTETVVENKETTTGSDVMEETSEIVLTAEARDGQAIAFTWEIPEGTEYDSFYLVRGEEVNPENDGKNYWFRQYYTRRSVNWADQPAGDWHYRICGVVDDACSTYSNNIELSIE